MRPTWAWAREGSLRKWWVPCVFVRRLNAPTGLWPGRHILKGRPCLPFASLTVEFHQSHAPSALRWSIRTSLSAAESSNGDPLLRSEGPSSGAEILGLRSTLESLSWRDANTLCKVSVFALSQTHLSVLIVSVGAGVWCGRCRVATTCTCNLEVSRGLVVETRHQIGFRLASCANVHLRQG